MNLRIMTIAVFSLFVAACGRDRGSVSGHVTFSTDPPPSFEISNRVKTIKIGENIWAAKVLRSTRLEDSITIQLEIDGEKYPSTVNSLNSYKKLGRCYTTEELKLAISHAFEVPLSSVSITRGVIPSFGGQSWEMAPHEIN